VKRAGEREMARLRRRFCNQDRIVFKKDLGPNTAEIAAATKLFDPDLSWAGVDVVNG